MEFSTVCVERESRNGREGRDAVTADSYWLVFVFSRCRFHTTIIKQTTIHSES